MQNSSGSKQHDCLHYVCKAARNAASNEDCDMDIHENEDEPHYEGELAMNFSFDLDRFQRLAIACVERNESVLIAAHTSAGKTVVAEYACAVCLREKQKIVYTSPIKALSNQKYREFAEKFADRGEGTVGLMTGDVTINPNAPIIVMTTEILRSMLYRASEILDEIAWVVFDEVHYMQDRERGVVWEETIIILPSEIRMVFLSATLPNAREFAEWIAHLRSQPCHVVYTEYRPTPLRHYGYAQGGDLMLALVDSKTGAFKTDTFDELLQRNRQSKEIIHRSGKIEEDGSGRWKKVDPASSMSKVDDLRKLVNVFKKKDLLPVIIFCFGKRIAEANAMSIVEVMDLTTEAEKAQIDTVFHKAMQNLSEADRSLAVIDNIKRIARNGVGIHHSGMLPILKEIIEVLFQEACIKVLCATETFAMGLNMPARTVLFTSIKKFDGVENRSMSSGEYIQMSGRAGRRGKDKKGYVVIMLDETTKKDECREILMGSALPLQSSFRLTYYTLLNLVQKVEGTQQSIDDIIRKSFNQFQHDRSIPYLQKELEELESRAAELTVDKSLLSKVTKVKNLKRNLEEIRRELTNAKLNHAHSLMLWTPGRLIHVRGWGVGIVIAPLAPAFSDPYFLDVALACRKTVDAEKPFRPVDIRNDPECVLGIFPVFLNQVEEVYRATLDVPADLTIEEEKKSLLEQFRRAMREFSGGVPVARWIEEIEIPDPSILTKLEKLETLEREMDYHQPADSEIDDSVEEKVEAKIRVMMQIEEVKKKMENSMMLSFQDEYKARMAVLKRLGHINSDGVLTLKGKAACEIDAADELVCAELLFDGMLKKIDRNYLISFLSCLVPFTDKTDDKRTELPQLQMPFVQLKELAKHVAAVSVECKVDIDPDEYTETFHLCFADVMHAWETGSTFGNICKLSDIYEGIIIRSARRLAELIQQLASAARVMGDMDLVKQLEESNHTLKRDIMFAASLYV